MPYIFTKLLKAQGIPIAIFFDDAVGAGSQICPIAGLELMMISPTGSPRLKFATLDTPLTRTQVLFMQVIPGLKAFPLILMAFVPN